MTRATSSPGAREALTALLWSYISYSSLGE
jgi:hypothetical protein